MLSYRTYPHVHPVSFVLAVALALLAVVPAAAAAGASSSAAAASAASHTVAAAMAAVTAAGLVSVAAARVANTTTSSTATISNPASVLGKRRRSAFADVVEDARAADVSMLDAPAAPASGIPMPMPILRATRTPTASDPHVRGRLPRAVMSRRSAAAGAVAALSSRSASPSPTPMAAVAPSLSAPVSAPSSPSLSTTPILLPSLESRRKTSDASEDLPAVAPADDTDMRSTGSRAGAAACVGGDACSNAAAASGNDADDDAAVPDVDESSERAGKRARVSRCGRAAGKPCSGKHNKDRVEFRVITVLRQSVNMCIYKHHDIARVKQLLSPVTSIPVSKMVIVLNSRVLADHETVANAGITENAILLVRFLRNDATLSLTVATLSGPLTTMIVSPSTKVGKVKRALADKHMMPVASQRLLYSTVPLDDDEPLSTYNMGESATILVLPLQH